MPQPVFGSVAFLAQCFFLQRLMNGYGKMTNVPHFNTIVGSSCNELRHRLTLQRETVAEFITRGAYDCIEMGHIGHLPVAVHQALQEKALREERDRAENGLRHSEARYRALAGNLSYGICRCDRDGKFLEVNEAMVKMLGYASKEELLGVNLVGPLIQDADKRAQLLGQSGQQGLVDPIEIECKRKDGAL